MATLQPEIEVDPQGIGWPGIVLIYLATVLSMATVGIIAALTLNLANAFDVPQKSVGLAISMFSLPSALAAVFCGGIIDRLGARTVIVASCAMACLASLLVMAMGSLSGLMLGLLLSGAGFSGIIVAAPVMLVSAAAGGRRVRAMSLWSTYAPTGFALGLLLAAPFASSNAWAPPLAIHATLMAMAAAAALTLPHTPRSGSSFAGQLRGFVQVFSDAGVLRLALAAAICSALSYGTSLVAPAYLAQAHGVGMGASATAVAAVKAVAMVLCGLGAGVLLARRINPLRLFAGLAVLGGLAQVAIFCPVSSFAVAIFGLAGWLVAYGGAAAVTMSLLPTVIRDPSQNGAASGLVGQVMSIFSFLAPTVYFGLQGWTGFVLLAAAGLAISVAALPAWGRRAMASA